jgi:hypothetical protein
MNDSGSKTREQSRPWQPPRLRRVGSIGEVLRTGGGKLSPSQGDPGEPRKPPGAGGESGSL